MSVSYYSTDTKSSREEVISSAPTSPALSKTTPRWERRRFVTLLVENHNERNDSRSFIQDLCSFVETLNMGPQQPEDVLGLIGNSREPYKLYAMQEATASPASVVCLDQLLKPGHRRIQRKERLQLAFRLSSAILQFCRTPWIDQSWTWKDFSALQRDEPQIALSQLFVSRKFYSARSSASINKDLHEETSLWSYYPEPILTKLGFALIEIAMGCSLSELRDEQPGQSNTGFDVLNLRTALKLLESGQIASEESQGYEAVVTACIKHQYKDTQNLVVKGLDSTDPSFFDNVEEAIFAPLYAECMKSWRPEPLDF